MIACGSMMAQRLGLESDLFRKIDEAHVETHNRDEDVCKRLRLYFSALAPAAALISLDKPEKALDAIREAEDKAKRPDFLKGNSSYRYFPMDTRVAQFRRDAAQLAIRAHIVASRHSIALSPASLKDAASHWREALRLGSDMGLEAGAARSISDLVIEHVLDIPRQIKEDGDSWNRIKGATDLLEAAYDAVRSKDGGTLRLALLEMLTARGLLLLDRGEFKAAYEDHRKAFELNKQDIEIRAGYCTAMVSYARQLEHDGKITNAIELIDQALKLVAEGLRIHERNTLLSSVQSDAQIEKDRLEGRDPRTTTYDVLRQTLERVSRLSPSPEGGQPTGAIGYLGRAAEKWEMGYWADAIADLEKALEIDPENRVARERLPMYCGVHASESLKRGDVAQAMDYAKKALSHDPDNETAKRAMKEIEGISPDSEEQPR
ncbi:MAG: hypothetical protein L0177_07995 [Chloroflexi bacterium]|nr:hypothetical protein [Chloroflexota bacterium]